MVATQVVHAPILLRLEKYCAEPQRIQWCGILCRSLFLRCMLVLAAFAFYSKSAFSNPEQNNVSATSVTTATLMELRELNGLNASAGLSISPNGRWAFVLEQRQDVSLNEVRFDWVMLDLETRDAKPIRYDAGDNIVYKDGGVLPIGFFNQHAPLWSSASHWFLLVRQEGDILQFWQGTTNDRRLQKIAAVPGEIDSATLSRNENEVYLSIRKTPSQLAEMLARERDGGYLFDDRFIPRIRREPLSDKPVYSRISTNYRPNTEAFVLNLRSQTIAPDMEAETRSQSVSDSTVMAPPSNHSVIGAIAASHDGFLAWREALDPEKQGFIAPATIVASTRANNRVVCRFSECRSDYFNLRQAGQLLRPDHARVLFARREGTGGAIFSLYEWRPEENRINKILSTTKTLEGCQERNNKWYCFESAPKEPRKLISIDLQTGARQLIYDPNPHFPTLEDVTVTYLSIELDGKLTTTAIVASPKDEVGPLVITSYTCRGFLKGSTGDEYPIFPLVSHGFSVLCFTHPPLLEIGEQTASPADYVRQGRGPGLPKWKLAHDALTHAIEIVKERNLAKTGKMAITGLSAGATLALYEIQNRKYDAAIVSSAVSSELFGVLGGAYQQDIFDMWGSGDRYFNEIRSDPYKIHTPLLINVAEQEFLSSIPIYRDLKIAGKAVELYVYAGEAHVKSQPRHRLAIYNRNIDWLRFWLKEEEDPAPNKENQYNRWRAMRQQQ